MRAGQAVEFGSYGDVEVLRFVEQPVPRPNRDEVLVEVVASAVNHMDAYLRRGDFEGEIALDFPSRQGSCFAGIVRGRGSDVKSVNVGAAVLGHDPKHGAHATYVVVPADAVVPKPSNLDWEVAGGMYLAGTVAYSVVVRMGLGPDDTVVVSAAAGGVGHIECQLARIAGATVVGIAGRENHDYLRSIGVKPVAYGEGLAERIAEAAKGRRITAFIDNYGSYEDLAKTYDLGEGRWVPTAKRRELEIRFFQADGTDPEPNIILRDLVELVAQWGLRVLVSGFYAFPDVKTALVNLDKRHSRGKVIIGMKTAAPPAHYLKDTLRSHYERSGG